MLFDLKTKIQDANTPGSIAKVGADVAESILASPPPIVILSALTAYFDRLSLVSDVVLSLFKGSYRFHSLQTQGTATMMIFVGEPFVNSVAPATLWK